MTALAVFASNLRADEGMWMLPLIQKMNGKAMKDLGCRLTPKQIYDINHTSLKDAIVQFGGGCTGEIISDQGLLVTNHHCGYGNIQKLSSVEHDYLKDGYWAMNRSEELPCEGLTVTFLQYMEDLKPVMEKARKKAEKQFKGQENAEEMIEKAIAAAIDEAVAKAEKKNPHCEVVVESFYNENVYYLIVYKVYRDIRFVGAPPSSIGKFGADTDNWMWPRHTGDFSMFRVYADKDNNPADYSPDNVPYRPKNHLRISMSGVQEGDFTFIYGFPGRTQEYIHSEGVRYIEEIGDPHKIHLRTLRLDIMSKYQSQSQKVRIQYSSKHANVANAWKKWQGEVKGIKKMKTVQTKQEFEAAFSKWSKGGEFDGVVEKIENIYKELEPYQFAADYYSETVRTIEMADLALKIAGLYIEGHEEGVVNFDQQKAREIMEAFYKDWYLPIDKECFIAVMNEYEKNVPAEFKPEYYKEQLEAYGSIEAWADICGWPVKLVDTAGIRKGGENFGEIEAEGVRRSEELAKKADIVIAFGDFADGCGIGLDPSKVIKITPKCDLKRGDCLNVSALTHEGVEELKLEIASRLECLAASADEVERGDGERYLSSLVRARGVLAAADFRSRDAVLLGNGVRRASQILGEAVGADYSDDLLTSLFSRFCVGK